jgi:hypothetical protein
VGLEELGQVLAQASLGRVGLLEPHLERPAVGCGVSRPPSRRG